MSSSSYEQRLKISCPHFPACSGCARNENLDAFPLVEEMRAFFQEKGIAHVPLHTGSPTHWRCRAKLAVRGSKEAPIIGLFKEGTHDPLDIPLCKVHHPAINRGADLLRQWMRDEGQKSGRQHS